MTLSIDKYVFRLQISINDVKTMNVLYSKDDLSDEEFGFMLLENLSLVEMISKIAPITVIQYHIEVIRGLEAVVHLDHEWMVGLLEDIALSDSVFQVLIPI